MLNKEILYGPIDLFILDTSTDAQADVDLVTCNTTNENLERNSINIVGNTFYTSRNLEESIQLNATNDDPALWVVNEAFINAISKEGFKQNVEADFSSSKRLIHDRYRYLNKSVFYRQLLNGEKQLRSWLLYSKSANAVFCGPCKLFGESKSLTTGYTDWSNINQRLREHEESMDHKTNIITFSHRCKLSNTLTDSLFFNGTNKN